MVLSMFLEPKEVVMTKDQFLIWYENKYSYGQVNLKLNKRLTVMLTFVFANLMMINNAFAKASVNTASLDKVGFTMLGIVRSFGYWILLILCLIEIIKSLLSGDTKGVGKIIVKYLLGFGALYFMPMLFDIVREAFN